MKIDKWIKALVVVVLVFSFMSSTAPVFAAKKQFVIGVSMPASDNPMWITMRKWIEKTLTERGAKYIMTIANENQAKQMTDVEDLISNKVDAIIIGPVDVKGSVGVIEEAVKAGIPVFTVGRRAQTDKVTAFAGSDEKAYGRTEAEFIARVFPNGAKVVHLYGPEGNSYTKAQAEGIDEVFAKYPNLKLVARLVGRDNRATGMKLMEDFLTSQKDFDAVVSCNDETAIGALNAIEAAGLKGKVVCGNSGNPDGIQRVKDGRMAFVNLKLPGKNGVDVATLVMDYLEGREIPKEILVQPVQVTKENVNSVDLKYTRDPE